MTRSGRVQTTCLTLANLLLPAAVLVFASGFFPYKPVLPGLAVWDDVEGVAAPEAAFDRVIFMVVDALRSDFVYGHESGFDFTQSLVRSGAAIPFTAHATPPTVTMPRVKALTTGSVPSFLDLILNFAESDTTSSLASQDTWLSQIKAKGGSIVFYGDDTWLKLFPDPDFFLRSDGTSSFFVSDFTEVDNNVTRHVPNEMKRSDWNAMVMHYLGLDHIGHKTGPQGPNMLPKQQEMDGIVREIYKAMEAEEHHANTLLVVAGDHGMNNGGNHGGSGPGETEPALLFASPKLKEMKKRRKYECPTSPKEGTEFHFYTKMEQSDLVPTLAGLMGLPISRNSLGVSIPELDGLWTDEQKLAHLTRNGNQILQIVEATFGREAFRTRVEQYKYQKLGTKYGNCQERSEGEQRLACLWAKVESLAEDDEIPSEQHRAAMAFLLEAQETLSGTASSYDIPRMIGGMVLTALILGRTFVSFPSIWPLSVAGTSFALISLLYGIMMFASSYVEEEQQFWYWLTPAWITLLSAKSLPGMATSMSRLKLGMAFSAWLAVHRLAARWNQTGQKHAGAPDIVHNFFPNAHVLMWIVILGTYGYSGILLVRRAFAGIIATELSVLLAAALVVPGIIFKLNFTQADAPELVQGLALQLRQVTERFDLVIQARIVFIGLATAAIIVITLSILSARESKNAGARDMGLLPTLAERLHHLLTLFLITQTRAPNVPLILGFEIQYQALRYIVGSGGHKSNVVTKVATSTLLLSHVYFFCMGGSNSISSIDLSNAYNGVADYNIVAVGVLLFASNWTGPIWWCSAANLLLNTKVVHFEPRKEDKRSWIDSERAKLHEDTLRTMMGPQKKTVAVKETGIWALYISSMTVFIAASLLAVMAACTALRTHLFIWTVFSPKYLYAMAWSVGWHLIVNISFGGLLSWAAGVA